MSELPLGSAPSSSSSRSMPSAAAGIGAIAKSRAVHFIVIGALLAWLAPREGEDRKIVFDPIRVDGVLRGERARVGRALSDSEEREAIASAVDEEVLAREAVRLGLSTDDAIVRARLAQQMQRSLASALPAPAIDEGEIAVEIAESARRAPEHVRLALWFVAREQPDAGRAAEAIARAIGDEGVDKTRGRGDRSPLPDGALWTEASLARVAGANVARAAMTTELGKPSAPLVSTWGFYVLVPLERRPPEASELRDEAIARLRERKQAAEVARLLARARRDYEIDVRGFERGDHLRLPSSGGGVD